MQEHLSAAEVRRAAKQSKKASLEQRWLESWRANYPTLPQPTLQHQFDQERGWKFDFAFIPERIAVEIDGGSFVNGGHNRPVQQQKDYAKARAAVRLGWRVLRYNTLDMKDVDACTQDVAELLTDAKEVA